MHFYALRGVADRPRPRPPAATAPPHALGGVAACVGRLRGPQPLTSQPGDRNYLRLVVDRFMDDSMNYVGVLHVRTGPFVTMVPPAPDMRDRAIVHGAWMTICVKCELTIKW